MLTIILKDNQSSSVTFSLEIQETFVSGSTLYKERSFYT